MRASARRLATRLSRLSRIPSLSPGNSGWAFLVNENTAKSLAFALRAAGYTADLDFAHILNFPPPHFGIMVLRLPDTMPTNDLTREVLNALAQLAGQSLAD